MVTAQTVAHYYRCIAAELQSRRAELASTDVGTSGEYLDRRTAVGLEAWVKAGESARARVEHSSLLQEAHPPLPPPPPPPPPLDTREPYNRNRTRDVLCVLKD